MSFFDEPFVDPTIVPRTADPRVTAWSTGEVQTAATHGYEQRAKQAQAAASGNPSGQGSRIVRPIQGTFKENSDARPPAWSPKETNVPETRRHAQSFASLASAQAPAKLFMKNTSSHEARSVLPHLRRQPEHWQMTPQSSKTDAKASIKGTAGQAAKSAKSDGPFPCTYDDCTRGFQKEREMLQHKADEHDYCPRCKLDFENDEALLEHKIDSEDHICCTVCGEDFMSEGGRDRHERQSHNSRQNIKCVGCGFIFDRGAGLIDHIYYNKCSNKGGAQPGKVNEFTLRENRVYAALDLDRKSHRRSTIAAEIAQMQPSMRGFVAEYASTDDGGVGLLDSANPDADSMPGALLPGENEGDVTSTPAPDDPIDPNKWPTIGEGLAKGIDAMRIVSSNSTLPRVRGFKSRGIFLQEDALAKPMPKKGDWTAPTMPDYRTSFLPGQQGRELIVRTDWDFLIFERHGVDNMFHCPFIHCGCNYPHIDDLKGHLTSGYHQGTDHRCLKCLRLFKTPVGLVAHMESQSERCWMRDTQAFGNVLHTISGGYLGVQGRHADGSIKIEVPLVDDEEKRPMLLTEDDDQDVEGREMILPPRSQALPRDREREW